jgi:hypothetical protein
MATKNEHAFELLLASVEVQLTALLPTGNTEPDGGTQTIDTLGSQLSTEVRFGYVTVAVHWPAARLMTIPVGHVRAGGVRSTTDTVKLQLAVLPAPSLTEQFTVVVPNGNNEPDAGVQTSADGIAQSSDAVTV